MIEWEPPDQFVGTTAAIIMAASAAATAGSGIYAASKSAGAATQGAQIQADANTKAAQLQAGAQANALAFQKQQAETDWQNQEVTRQANYNQWLADTQRKGAIGSLFGLPAPNIPAYVPTIDPKYTTGQTPLPSSPTAPTSTGTLPGSIGSLTSPPSQTGTAATMPTGIDPRFAALYQKYGVTPGSRGSGAADWQYWQQDAVSNAGGDVNYVLGRLEQQLQGGAMGTTPAPTAPTNPGAIGNWNAPLTGSIPLSTPLLGQPGQPGYGIGGY